MKSNFSNVMNNFERNQIVLNPIYHFTLLIHMISRLFVVISMV